jgi:four helix bundle protein
MQVVVEVYHVTSAFPVTERFGLIQQARRAAISVPSNIAEGQARRSKREFVRFIIIALGSLAELESQLLVAERLGLIPPDRLSKVLQLVSETGRLLRGLERSLVNRAANDLP